MQHLRIKRDPKVMMGKPIIAGTRITVEHILRCLAAGNTLAHILRNYPHLTEERHLRGPGLCCRLSRQRGVLAAE